MAMFTDLCPLTRETTILDVGGTPDLWSLIPEKPRVTMLNRGRSYDRLPSHLTSIDGDARALDFPDGSFDIVFSNSVIEHVGNWEDQMRCAAEMRRVGRAYYVQTPNLLFPVEPHVFALGVHWLPMAIRRRVVRWASLWGLRDRPTQAQVDAMLDDIRLLSAQDMRTLFPDAEIHRERIGLLTKSLIAVRRG